MYFYRVENLTDIFRNDRLEQKLHDAYSLRDEKNYSTSLLLILDHDVTWYDDGSRGYTPGSNFWKQVQNRDHMIIEPRRCSYASYRVRIH